MSDDSFYMGFNKKQEKAFREWVQSTYQDATPAFKKVMGKVGSRLKKRVVTDHLSGEGDHSLGVGPGRYGHLRDNLIHKYGAIGMGGYVRIKFRKGPRFKARFHEFGTEKGENEKGTGRGMGLPARAPLRTGFDKWNEQSFYREADNALDKLMRVKQ